MTDHLTADENIALLENAGFELTERGFVLAIGKPACLAQEGEIVLKDEDMIRVVDADTLEFPTEDTQIFLAINGASDCFPGSHDLILKTHDVRDIIAFHKSLSNCLLESARDAGRKEAGFTFQGKRVVNPFAADGYFGWAGKIVQGWVGSGRFSLVVEHPLTRELKDAYVSWRDDLCEPMLQPAPGMRM